MLTWYCEVVLLNDETQTPENTELIFARPVSGNIKWPDIEALLVALGAKISEREGSRMGVVLFGEIQVFH